MEKIVGGRSGVDRRQARRVRALLAAVAFACVGTAAVLGDHGQRVVGGLLMAVALVAALVADVAAAASER